MIELCLAATAIMHSTVRINECRNSLYCKQGGKSAHEIALPFPARKEPYLEIRVAGAKRINTSVRSNINEEDKRERGYKVIEEAC